MIERKQIRRVAVDDGVSEELKNDSEALNLRIDAWNENWEELRQKRADFAADKPDSTMFEAAEELLHCEVDLLIAEKDIRDEAIALYDRHRHELQELRTVAHKQCEQAKATIKKKLSKLGYSDVEPHVDDPCKILPIHINSHPTVHFARQRCRELQNKSHDVAAIRVHRAAIDDIEQRLSAIQQRVMNF